MYNTTTCPDCGCENVRDRFIGTGIYECECGLVFSKSQAYGNLYEENERQNEANDWYQYQDKDEDWIGQFK